MAFSGLSGLKELSLRTGNSEWPAMVMELDRDAFTGLNSLEKINLTGNNVWTLPKGVFCSLDRLKALNVSRNFLQDLLELGFSSDSVLSCRIPLETIDLSMNGVASIPGGAFSQLSASLQRLHLNGNGLSMIEDGAFDGLGNLRILDLADNGLVAIPPTALRQTTRLQRLNLQNNSLSSLAPGLFEAVGDSLLVLNLSSNAITSEWVDADTFSGLENLVALDLSWNKLSRFSRGSFSDLTSLRVLDLSGNQLVSLGGSDTFKAQRNLHILQLSHNSLESLHPKSISSLPKLGSLALDNNRLRSLHPKSFKDCPSLQDLALNDNNLGDVPKAVRSLPLLRTLHLGGNSILNGRMSTRASARVKNWI